MEIFVYRKDSDKVEEGFTAAELPGLLKEKDSVIWVDLLGEKPEQIEETRKLLLEVFNFHPLTVEDCIETRNQPKVEAFPDQRPCRDYGRIIRLLPGSDDPAR